MTIGEPSLNLEVTDLEMIALLYRGSSGDGFPRRTKDSSGCFRRDFFQSSNMILVRVSNKNRFHLQISPVSNCKKRRRLYPGIKKRTTARRRIPNQVGVNGESEHIGIHLLQAIHVDRLRFPTPLK